MAFPGTVADIIECEPFNLFVDLGYKGPPYRVWAKSTFFKMFECYGYFLWGFFVIGEFLYGGPL